MNRKVAIVGYRQTRHSTDCGLPRERLVYELVKSLFADLKITRDDIGTFVICSNDFQDGRTISECYMIPRFGAFFKDETKTDSDGANAVLYALMRILSGTYDTALVMGYAMGGSEFKNPRIIQHTLDPIYERPLNLTNDVSAAALQARAYMQKSRLSEKQLAKIAAKNLRNCSKNPYAARGKADATPEDVLKSRPLYSPLHELHCHLPVDGACALVLASEKRARELTRKPVWIKGVGHCQDTYYLGERDLVKMESLQKAAKKAYQMAGVTNPAQRIGVAELHTNFASEEPIFAEALGLFPKNSGGKVIEKGLSEIDGKLPLNPSGGPLGANPMTTTGLLRILEACAQLRGEAGEHQVDKPKLALAHGQTGILAQHNVVFVLGN